MGKLKVPPKVKFFTAMLSKEENMFYKVKPLLTDKLGDIEFESDVLLFDHTRYYEEEMGHPLLRKFFSFKPIYTPDKLPEIKLYCMEIEDKFRIEGKRKINIDPGYVELSKVVLASTKNYSHRIYIRDGIFAEVTLYFHKREFRDFHYTYPDYREKSYKNFFEKIRESLKNESKNL